ncbi:thioredoxin family protein [Aureisphaera galaxeae]|uniref:thioredoxin family protein n=1 Tax=Aureisphaera galaxeae TaxID=1538023 RepID=UPI002350AF0A|nr:thioredoxin family protein [Aureisphaera galaxeae]MDC8004571.1 thioredoxin family protein [Aureisphaera galaxeae]
MKVYAALLFTLLFCTSAIAQEWLTDFESAKTKASRDSKHIVLVFQGSDWCAPCIKLDKEIWSTEAFKKYAESHYVMLQADFPRKKKNALPETQQQHNNGLAEKYNPNGIFPFVAILNSEGFVLGETGYKKISPDEYITHINSFIQ